MTPKDFNAMQLAEPLALSIEQVAMQVQVHTNTIRRMIRAGSIKGVRIGRAWRIPRSEVLRICGSSVPAATDQANLKAGGP
jgi:excisionase family DNA binding protein